jgi:hypothetical protein
MSQAQPLAWQGEGSPESPGPARRARHHRVWTRAAGRGVSPPTSRWPPGPPYRRRGTTCKRGVVPRRRHDSTVPPHGRRFARGSGFSPRREQPVSLSLTRWRHVAGSGASGCSADQTQTQVRRPESPAWRAQPPRMPFSASLAFSREVAAAQSRQRTSNKRSKGLIAPRRSGP